jgi:hypothetical protein
MAEQAYSTPAPLAYVASRLADVKGAKSVLEPTAGNGMLLIEATRQSRLANEIDRTRAAALEAQGFAVLMRDATRPLAAPQEGRRLQGRHRQPAVRQRARWRRRQDVDGRRLENPQHRPRDRAQRAQVRWPTTAAPC